MSIKVLILLQLTILFLVGYGIHFQDDMVDSIQKLLNFRFITKFIDMRKIMRMNLNANKLTIKNMVNRYFKKYFLQCISYKILKDFPCPERI